MNTTYADPNSFGFGFDGRGGAPAQPPAPQGVAGVPAPNARPAPKPQAQAAGGLGLQFGHFGQTGGDGFNGFGGGFTQQQVAQSQRPTTAAGGQRPQTANAFGNSLAGQAQQAQHQRRPVQAGNAQGQRGVTLPDDLKSGDGKGVPVPQQGYYGQVPQYNGYVPHPQIDQQAQYGAYGGFDNSAYGQQSTAAQG